ncbi:MAG: aldo/keto reductase [Desulfuromonas sp.]|nr:MAG: aldo/keto reductase [Desulfuromonas sp.]
MLIPTPLGHTGLNINRLVYGTLPLGPLQSNLSPEEGGKLIRYALEQGVTLLDTAALYGTYPHIREGPKGYDGEVIIASKTHAATACDARAHVEQALKELDRSELDIVHLHGARLQNPFLERAEVFAELKKMKMEGMIRRLGVSCHYISAVEQAAENPDIEVVHPLINKNGMGIIDGSAAEMAAAIKRCADNGKGVYAMKALAGGNLISEARASLRYVLDLPGVHAIAVGLLSKAEIDGNLALFNEGVADPATWEKLESRLRTIKIMDQFCKGCGACIPSCSSQALRLENGKAKVEREACILCGYCAAACPEFFIRVV